MIGQIIGSLGGLAQSYIDSKTQIKITEAEIKKKQLTGEMDWEQSAIEASNNSYKDELWTIVFVLISCASRAASSLSGTTLLMIPVTGPIRPLSNSFILGAFS